MVLLMLPTRGSTDTTHISGNVNYLWLQICMYWLVRSHLLVSGRVRQTEINTLFLYYSKNKTLLSGSTDTTHISSNVNYLWLQKCMYCLVGEKSFSSHFLVSGRVRQR